MYYNRLYGGKLDLSHSRPAYTKQDAESSLFRDRYGGVPINPESFLKQRYSSHKDDGARCMTEEEKDDGSRIKTSINRTTGPSTHYQDLMNS
jgi:hypothetical protein